MATKKTCTIPGCDAPMFGHGWCNKHYLRWRKYGDPFTLKRETPNRNPPRTCLVEGCEKKHFGKGFCSMHYTRYRRHGCELIKLQAAPGECREWIEAHVNYDGDECLTWPFGRGGGGGAVVSTVGGKSMMSASRVMCELAHGAPPEADYECAHSCGNGHLGCMNPKHLRWDTREGNLADKLIHGTHNRGHRHPKAILTETEVIEILTGAEIPSELCRRYGVTKSTISAIRRRKIWAHIEV